MMKLIMIDHIVGIKMILIPMVALDNTSNRLWLAALPILPELRFWFIGTIKQLEEEFEQRELYSHDLECSSICIQVVSFSRLKKIGFIYICLTYIIIIMAFFVVLSNAILFPLKNFVVHNWMKGTSFTIPFPYNGLWASKLHVTEKNYTT